MCETLARTLEILPPKLCVYNRACVRSAIPPSFLYVLSFMSHLAQFNLRREYTLLRETHMREYITKAPFRKYMLSFCSHLLDRATPRRYHNLPIYANCRYM